MTLNKTIKIFISCHKPSRVIEDEVFTPIETGAVYHEKSLSQGILRDNTGDNISSKNPMYCELTAQYWAWKNVDADYYGFCHYRRYFNLTQNEFPEDSYGDILEPYLLDGTAGKYGISWKNVQPLLSEYDLLVSKRQDLRKLPGNYKTPQEQYAWAKYLHAEDYQLMLDIIDQHFPEYTNAARTYSEGHYSSFCNMFIMKKDMFVRYCSWLFAVLDIFCRERDMSGYSREALRTPGHLAERLLNIFIIHLQEENRNIRIKELQTVYLQNTDWVETLCPAFDHNNIPVVFAADDNYIPYFSACLQSVIDHSSPQNNYDLVLISKNISRVNQDILRGMTAGYDHISLRFYNPMPLLGGYRLHANAHITEETYYRFLIQEILPHSDKVLYLDCDLIVNSDIAKLFTTDVSGYMLAATLDPDFLGQIGGADLNTQEYVQTKLQLKNPANYFQAGVILFNEEEMRKSHSIQEWLGYAETPYRYNDQDVLNLYCEGRVKFLDMSWNLITDMEFKRFSNVISYASATIQNQYEKAHQNPAIIHYAGCIKPWNRPEDDLARYFWKELRKTPYYEIVLANLCRNGAKHKSSSGKITEVVNQIFPVSTKRRAWLDRVYMKLHR